MTNSILLVAGGLVLLALGGELLVRGAVGMAARLGISPLLAGLTIVGFGTSMPELATSVQAAMGGSPGIALGNVIGSNVANSLLVLGVSALILPIAVNPASFKRDSIAMGGAALLATAAVMLGVIGMLPGVILFCALVGYIWWAYKSESASDDDEA
ncbi:MAG: sodium:calcium antiporter, partial [Alphaproteobacteria bacterium HGW-Alphaproteobacteria-15]